MLLLSANEKKVFLSIKKPRHPFPLFAAIYSLAFILAALVTFYPFYAKGLTLVWTADGATQYILWLKYTSAFLKKIISQAFKGHFSINFYDFSIGLGSDAFPFLKSDPVLLAGSLFVTDKNLGVLYSLLTLIRIYLAGISFGIFSSYRRTPLISSVTAALIYAFSGYSFYYIIRHPQFGLGAIYLPLMLTAAMICFEEDSGKKKVFFPVIIAVSLMSHYYFHYMNTIALCVYFVLAFLFKKDKGRSWKPYLRGVFSYLLGCGIAAVAFFPSISMYLFSDRNILAKPAKRDAFLMLFKEWPVFSLNFLAGLPGSLIVPSDTQNGPASLFVSLLLIPCMVVLFCRKDSGDGPRILRPALLLVFLCRCMPIVTGIFTMFSTHYDRWSYIAVFVFACVVAENLHHLSGLTRIQAAFCLLPAGLYLLLYLTLYYYEYDFLISALLLFVLCVLLMGQSFIKIRENYFTAGLLLFAAMGLMWNGFHYNVRQTSPMRRAFLTNKEVYGFYKNTPFEAAAKLDDSTFYRTDTPGLGPYELNGSVASGIKGTTCYQSTINKSVISWSKQMESAGLSSLNLIMGTDLRNALGNLLSVKYVISSKDEDITISPGFYEDLEAEETIDHTYDVYRNINPVSVAHAYKDMIRESEYQRFSALDKQEMLLKYAVVPDQLVDDPNLQDSFSKDSSGRSDKAKNFGQLPKEEGITEPLPLKITKTDSFIQKDGTLYTVDSSDYEDPYLSYEEVGDLSKMYGIHFEIDVPDDTELYLRVSGLSIKEQNTSELYIDTDKAHKYLPVQNKNNDYYTGLKDYSLYLGRYKKGEKVAGLLSFSNDDIYTIDQLEAIRIPTLAEQELIKERSQSGLTGNVTSSGHVLCNVSTNKNPYIVFSIPWQNGWKAYVDGKKTKLYRSNDCFMGLSLKDYSDGEHKIELVFLPYGILEGLAVSIGSLFLLLIYMLRNRATN